MITPRRGSETRHYMHMTRFRSGLYPIRQETTIYRRCQVCNNRRKLSKHPLGLKVCPICTKAINEMLLSQNVQLQGISQWDDEKKQEWITKVDQLGLYKP
jgi:hypothetical protein